MTEAPQLPRTPMASGGNVAAAQTGTFGRAEGSSWATFCFPAAVLLQVLAVAACGGSEKPSAASAPANPGQRSESIEHERCDVSGGHAEDLDTNGDGKPDIRRVYDGSKHELCRAVDLNHDGKTDLYEYFDASGAIRRREFCYDDTGAVNAVESYSGGKLVEREYDTTGQHRIDTWDFFDSNTPIDAKTGRPTHPARRERDLRGGGMIDQWWTWNGDLLSIATDTNGDGKPDPATTVILGGDDGGATPSAATTALPAATPPSDSGLPSISNAARSDAGNP